MIPSSRVHQACGDLFDAYPLAVVAVDDVPTMHSMVLMLAGDDDVCFFVLLRDCGDGTPAYTVIPWHADGPVTIEPDGGDVPDLAANAVLRGVPIPRDGALFGWIHGDPVTALTAIYARYTPETPVPTWSVLPLAGAAEADWPPFTDEPLFGHWFWDHYRAGSIIDLGDVIAATADTVFWVDTYAALGSDCCVVACDIKTPDGHVLRRGTYVDSATLQAGIAVPTPAELLADAEKTDLAPRFRMPAHSGSWQGTEAEESWRPAPA
jgi:hypothetical protein